MILCFIKMEARPEKHRELIQTLISLNDDVRKVEGCLSHFSFKDLEGENNFSLIQTWDTQNNFEAFLGSDLFQVLKGAAVLLSESNISKFTVVYELDDQKLLQENVKKRSKNR